MSDTLTPPYHAEDHAPDPVFSHGDPTPPGKVGIWLFLASEIMFFIGILGSYIVIRSGWPHLFEQQGKALSKLLAGINTLVLIFSSLTMALAVEAAKKSDRKRLMVCLGLTFACALTFMCIKYIEYSDKFHHYTIATNEGGKRFVYDGHWDKSKNEIHGVRLALDNVTMPFDISFAGKEWIEERIIEQREAELADKQKKSLAGTGEKIDTKIEEQTYKLAGATISQSSNYGPWKNLFFSCYFAATGVHGVHVVGGMIPLALLAIQAKRGKIFPQATEYVGLYWHFVDLVWIFLFPLMYLI